MDINEVFLLLSVVVFVVIFVKLTKDVNLYLRVYTFLTFK